MSTKNKDFIESIKSLTLNQSEFSNNTALFSCFISSIDANYKYNSTFLLEFLQDYYIFIEMVKKKTDYYSSLRGSVISLLPDEEFILLLDDSFQIRHSKDGSTTEDYPGLDVKKIVENNVLISLSIDEKRICFSKIISCKDQVEFEDGMRVVLAFIEGL